MTFDQKPSFPSEPTLKKEKASLKAPVCDIGVKKESEKHPSDLKEIGGFENRPEPVRYGDWEVRGRCSDF